MENIPSIVEAQRAYFNTGVTRPYAFRRAALVTLRDALTANGPALESALFRDLHKAPEETYMCETGMVLDELRFHLRHLRAWLRPRRVPGSLAQFPAHGVLLPEPYGVSLILAPWNYPLQLCLSPLIGAISGGNCAVLKPSAYAPETSRALAKLLRDAFPPEYIAVVEGGRTQNSELLDQPFDTIFFTGSVAVGKVVMEAASRRLTPVTLELGGKSPCIVDATADIPLAARRIAFGKVLNAGQTCVAPDYLLIHESVRDRFVTAYADALREFFPNGDYGDLPVIVNQKHFERVRGLMEGQRVLLGGGSDPAARRIEPTLLGDVSPDAPVMQEEIFGPVLPVLTFRDLNECVDFVRARPRPLALYLFTRSRENERRILDSCSFGGGCVNDTVFHLLSPRLPFGGVGCSGMGEYHGRASFDTFTHRRSVLKRGSWPDVRLRYHPYSEKNERLIRRVMK